MQEDKKIKVLFLSAWYPSKKDPMLGLFVERHARAVSIYCDVCVLYILPVKRRKNKKPSIEIKQEGNFTEIILYYPALLCEIPVLGTLYKTYKFMLAYKKGFREVKKHFGRYDIIHVNILTRTGFIAYLKNLFHGVPYIITEHWSRYLPGANAYHRTLRKIITRRVVRHASAVTTVTAELRKAMLKHKLKNKNYLIVPNVVDTDMFKPVEKPASSIKTFIHVSCFEDKSKNISGLLTTIKSLSEKRTDFICRLIGEGIDKTALEKYAENLGLKNKFVVFEGLKEGAELVQYFQNADFLVLFSNYETMSVVILEAFACGLPVVSTDVGGIHEVVYDTRGILIMKGDRHELELALIDMLDNSAQFNKHELRKLAVENYSTPKVGRAFYNIYKKALNK